MIAEIGALFGLIIILFSLLMLKITNLETKVRDLELSRTQATNDIVYLKGAVRRLERNDI
jgi:hypothetical protein